MPPPNRDNRTSTVALPRWQIPNQGDLQKRISPFFERGRGLSAPSLKKWGYSFLKSPRMITAIGSHLGREK